MATITKVETSPPELMSAGDIVNILYCEEKECMVEMYSAGTVYCAWSHGLDFYCSRHT